jgi:hypothetical protein
LFNLEDMMKLQNLFTINLIFAIIFGVSCAVFPSWVFQLYGLPADASAIWVCRLVGGSILGYATLMWFGRKAASLDARRAIALALFAQDSVGLIASLEIQLKGIVNLFGWFSLALYAVLALAYAYFLFIRPQAS